MKNITAGAMNLRLAAIRLLNSSVAATRSQSADRIVSFDCSVSFSPLSVDIVSPRVNSLPDTVIERFMKRRREIAANRERDYMARRATAPKPIANQYRIAYPDRALTRIHSEQFVVPPLGRKRQLQIHSLIPNACGLKAGLRTDFPQESAVMKIPRSFLLITCFLSLAACVYAQDANW